MSRVLSVNVARPRPNPAKPSVHTGIDKVPTDEPVEVRQPQQTRGGDSGVTGDVIGNHKLHGGDDQAVYAYAREDLDAWERSLGRTLDNGNFGENFTTADIDLTDTLVGERWSVGTGGLLLEVTSPRTPCKTFVGFLEVPDMIKRFTAAGLPGAYLRVINPGTVRGGDKIEVVERPDHDVTVALVFQAMMVDSALFPQLIGIEGLPKHIKKLAERRAAS
jgi:MOSC domain-containing protein YiiM